ncbi:MAG: hypothetical protein Q8P81_00675 [Nanoarchaeota archaeon]|nr:hypothetical protein [Nanoarchaeota archaeon]
MKKWTIFLLLFLVLPLASAEAVIILDQQPKSVYSFGDRLNIPITVTTNQGVYDFLQVSLLCGAQQHVFPKDSVDLGAGEVKKIDKSVLLIKRFVGDISGTCKIRAGLEDIPENYIFSNEFKISNALSLDLQTEKSSFNPGEVIFVSGKAINDNGKASEGMFELKLVGEEVEIFSQGGVVSNGFFSVNVQVQNNTPAGTYLLSVTLKGSDPLGEVTNQGSATKELVVNQVPTNLEVVLENNIVEPGTDLRAKAVLWDQTGEKIDSEATIQVKNSDGKIVEQSILQTDEFLNLPIVYNEVPSSWNVEASSEGIINEINFTISEKKDLGIEILDRTLILTNIGNIPYNDTATVKVGNETLYIDVYLGVDEERKYLLTAPDGNYTVEVLSGDKSGSGFVSLTGKSVDVSESSGKDFVRYSFVWLFIILVLGFVTVVAFKRGYQKTFVGYVSSKVNRRRSMNAMATVDRPLPSAAVFRGTLVNPKSRAELSLSIKGNKQEVCVVALNLKNLEEIQSGKGNVKETLQRIVDVADEDKASTYEGNGAIFFILAPERTKTFNNERAALNIAKKAKEILSSHNRMFQQKIPFGISLNQGAMVVKQDQSALQFMSLGNLMSNSKKISSLAVNDVLLSENMNDRLRSYLKTVKSEEGGLAVYSIKEIRNPDNNKEFLKSFLDRNQKSN